MVFGPRIMGLRNLPCQKIRVCPGPFKDKGGRSHFLEYQVPHSLSLESSQNGPWGIREVFVNNLLSHLQFNHP